MKTTEQQRIDELEEAIFEVSVELAGMMDGTSTKTPRELLNRLGKVMGPEQCKKFVI